MKNLFEKIIFPLFLTWWIGMLIMAILLSFEIISIPTWVLEYPTISACGTFGIGIILAVLALVD